MPIDEAIDMQLAFLATQVERIKNRKREGADCQALMSEAFCINSLNSNLRAMIEAKANGKTTW